MFPFKTVKRCGCIQTELRGGTMDGSITLELCKKHADKLLNEGMKLYMMMEIGKKLGPIFDPKMSEVRE
jgi:hypothetical protein